MKCPVPSTNGGDHAVPALSAHVRRCPACRARVALIAEQARALRRLARAGTFPLLGRILGHARDAARRELGVRLVELHRLCRVATRTGDPGEAAQDIAPSADAAPRPRRRRARGGRSDLAPQPAAHGAVAVRGAREERDARGRAGHGARGPAVRGSLRRAPAPDRLAERGSPRGWDVVRGEAGALSRRLSGLHQRVDLAAIALRAPAPDEAAATAAAVIDVLGAAFGRGSWRALVVLADARREEGHQPAAWPSLRDSLAPQ